MEGVITISSEEFFLKVNVKVMYLCVAICVIKAEYTGVLYIRHEMGGMVNINNNNVSSFKKSGSNGQVRHITVKLRRII